MIEASMKLVIVGPGVIELVVDESHFLWGLTHSL
jgi:hypothetical protein